jgi:hypothetical protein
MTLCVFAFCMGFNSFLFADSKETAKQDELKPMNHLFSAMAGTGFGISYSYLVAENFGVGVFSSLITPDYQGGLSSSGLAFDTNNQSYIQSYDSRQKASSISFGFEGQMFSGNAESWTLGTLLGATRFTVERSGYRSVKDGIQVLEDTNLSATQSSWGFTGGLSGGYLYGFDNGFRLGILAKLLFTSAKSPSFDAPPSKFRFSNSLSNESDAEAELSCIGIGFGYAF